MIRSIDQIGNEVLLAKRPERIISLVPSQTEYLHWLGLEGEVVGITKFCVHPNSWFRNKTRIGGTKKLNVDLIKELNPDLIIANKEENDKEQVKSLAKHFPVWTSDVKNIDDAKKMLISIAGLVGKKEKGRDIIRDLDKILAHLINQKLQSQKVLYLIWENPMMTIGGDTFINEMLRLISFQNIFQHQNRYPEISSEELKKLDVDLVLLSSEPFPFKDKHVEKYQRLFPTAKVLKVDGEIFSWYGSRLLQMQDYFLTLRKQID